MAEMVALVTGAASGIGAATARLLAREGATGLVLIDRDRAGLDRLVGELAATPVLPLAHDVADEAAWTASEAAICERFGGLQQAVVNAGIADGSPIVDTTLAAWRKITSVNLDGAMLTLRTAMRLMAPAEGRAGGGAIVTLASVAGVKAEAGQGAYCASKAGLLHLTRVAAREGVASGIRVNAVCPGGVATPLWRTLDFWPKLIASKGSEEAALAAMAVNTPVGRFATADEIADIILALLRSPVTTGAHIVVDGGYSL